jgi:hypothetical protein
MSTQVQIHPGSCRLVDEFRSMHEEDFEGFGRHATHRPGQVVTTVVMRVIDADEPRTVAAPAQRHSGIDQHDDAQTFKLSHLLPDIVIAEDTDCTQAGLDAGEDFRQMRVYRRTWPTERKAIVSGQHTEIDLYVAELGAEALGQAWQTIGVEIREMQDRETAKSLRQPVGDQAHILHQRFASVVLSPRTQPGKPQSTAKEGAEEP